jgi:putative sporulation protein YtaF
MVLSVPLLLLALAVSIDSFSVGFTYGLRKMRIPFTSIAVISLCSAGTLIVGMVIGHFIESVLSPDIAESIGGVILILLGAWVLAQFFRTEKQPNMLPHPKTIVNFEIKSLGIVIQILRKPMSADFDQSGTINGIEAYMLGLALSLDAFGAGIGAAMLDFSPSVLGMAVAFMSFLFIYVGLQLGKHLSENSWLQRFAFLPGVLLIIIGVWKI